MSASVRAARGRGRAPLAAAWLSGALALLLPARLGAQDESTRDELWPEIDAYVALSGGSRLFLLAALARNREVDFAEGMVGAHVDLFVAPLARGWLRHTPDVQKRRYLSFRVGYRYSWDLDDREEYEEHRVVLEATGRFTGPLRSVLVNRSRADLRHLDGEWSWRYRNRTRLERDLALGRHSVTPYAMVEFFYDSRYDAWNRQRYFAGVEWPLFGAAILDTYYCRQNDSRASVAHVDALGLALNLYF